MPLKSAGILLYKIGKEGVEVFLVHPGGPFFKNKNKGWWTIPKGAIEENESIEQAAFREFEEETGVKIKGDAISLDYTIQKSGKWVYAFAVEGEIPDNFILNCNTFEMEWPPNSGSLKAFPEVDEARFFKINDAYMYIMEAQQIFLDRLKQLLN